jgi:lipoate-protein ligase A
MQLLDLTLGTPAENLALDEALLDAAQAGECGEVLRLWESPQPLVVVGRASEVAVEVNLDVCRQREIPVLRRTSGGAAVVAGPGCLLYAVVLSYELRPELRMIDQAHRFVLETIAGGLKSCVPTVARRGISDLTVDGRMKCSGNSLRASRSHVLYHGTLLYDFPLALVGQLLLTPPRQPDYREQRAHGDFVANLPMSVSELRRAVTNVWGFPHAMDRWPQARTAHLAAEKYSTEAWNLRR